MPDDFPQIHRIPCVVRRVQWVLASAPCDRCQRPARRVWTVTRSAVDIDLDYPVLLAVDVSVHHCGPCRHYFRAQPPFLRPDSLYANRVVRKAVEAVFRDGLAWRRAGERLARDFWVHPSEKMVRRWCAAYARGVDFDRDYLPWVVETFSGVLCVDEVCQGKLALLLAVDPAGPDGDRLVGYQLVEGTVDQGSIARFLQHLLAAGIQPDQVITDGASIYPPVLAQVWPSAARQLCLFHETRRVTTAVDDVAKAVRKKLPTAPPAARLQLGGRKRTRSPPDDATDSASARWRWRQDRRRAGLAQVHMSQFLRDASWEATNNGAERMGRAFRHRQGPHFNLRTTTPIEAALKVRADQHKEAIITAAPILENRCSRGRPSRLMQYQPALAMAA